MNTDAAEAGKAEPIDPTERPVLLTGSQVLLGLSLVELEAAGMWTCPQIVKRRTG